jgi:hypothetical protein
VSRVQLHTGNPSTEGPRTTKASRNRTGDSRLTSAPCTWCGGKSTSKSASRRCKRCRKLELIIESASRFMHANGLRALDRSTSGGSDAEQNHRSAAARAKKTLNGMKRDRLSKNSAPKSALNLPKDPAAKTVKQISDLEVALATLAIKIAELETSEASALRDRQLEALRRRRAGFELGLARRRAKL